MIDLNAKYETREGYEVVGIYHLKKVTGAAKLYPLVVEVLKHGDVSAAFYTEDGMFTNTAEGEHPCDLVTKTKMEYTFDIEREVIQTGTMIIKAYSEEEAEKLVEEKAMDEYATPEEGYWDCSSIDITESDLTGISTNV